ncbi:MAG: PIN domain-containing protein [bacterium]
METEPVLLDTNLLIYASDADSPYHDAARTVRDQIEARQAHGCLTPQVLYEFYSVVTGHHGRPPRVTPAQASGEIETYLRAGYRMIYPRADTLAHALRLARDTGVTGQGLYDCVLAATALDNGVSLIYTANTADFQFPGLRAVNPLRS